MNNHNKKLGTFNGVYIPILLSMLGAIMYIRMLFVVGEAGITGTMAIFLISLAISVLTFISVTAIATNSKVGDGGAYYIISRTLGPGSGITIGLVYFIYVFLAIPFCILAFCESIVVTFPVLEPYLFYLEIGVSVVLFLIAFLASSLIVKAQYLQIGIIALSIIFFLGGAATKFSSDTFMKNLHPPLIHSYVAYVETSDNQNSDNLSNPSFKLQENPPINKNNTIIDTEEDWNRIKDKHNLLPSDKLVSSKLEHEFPKLKEELSELDAIDRFQLWLESSQRYDFWMLFAIFMPVVTGIMTGANMSSKLRTPSRSIVLGSFMGIFTVFAIFIAQSILFAGVANHAELIKQPFETLCNNALFGWSWVIVLGVAVASIASAVCSILGAPLLLQAMGQDKILNWLTPFSVMKGTPPQPRRALLFCAIINLLFILALNCSSGNSINILAKLMTLFALYTFLVLNLCACVEGSCGNPSFRPTFKYFHWSISLLGAIVCFFSALFVDAMMTGICLAFLLGLYVYLTKRRMNAKFEDARGGLAFEMIRKNIKWLTRANKNETKNWRPNILLLCNSLEEDEPYIRFASLLEGGCGINLLACIYTSKGKEGNATYTSFNKTVSSWLAKNSIDAYPRIFVDNDELNNIKNAIMVGTAGLVPSNLVVIRYNKNITSKIPLLKTLPGFGMSLLMVHTPASEKKYQHATPQKTEPKLIDIWIGQANDADLMVILAWLMTKSPNWAGATIRLLRIIPNPKGQEKAQQAMADLATEHRIKAQTKVVIAKNNFPAVINEHSANSDCVFISTIFDENYFEENWLKQRHKIPHNMNMPVIFCIGAEKTYKW